MKTHYETLSVSKDASQDQIKLAYRKLSKKYHPDVNGGSKDAEKIFLEVQEAYTVLKNKTSREEYDRQLENASHNHDKRKAGNTANKQTSESKQAFNIHDMEKNFEQFFGFNPKSKEMQSKSHKGKKNPIDTSDLFERYFNK
ncbi:J domain-containing protein [Solibacillus merdavium]|uniref:J domain-containing protein n=1 Tax=Solibacillus merdavium TaxID=2762218 RepID=A0ABR8XJ86_9BACL|nr:DnaJ domain-containing protein [Solibacillus merdavium]MBD8032003.1 J domain-containing protein [Solibacillus merdavium]